MFGGNWALWSIKHKNIVYFFAFLVLVMGLYSFNSLGRMEDPSFTVKQMVVSAAWPGATAKETEEHVTLALEKQIQNTPDIDKITSYSRPGTAVITVQIKDEVPNDKVRAHWLELRNTVNDCRDKLPEGVIGPFSRSRIASTMCTAPSTLSAGPITATKSCAVMPNTSSFGFSPSPM